MHLLYEIVEQLLFNISFLVRILKINFSKKIYLVILFSKNLLIFKYYQKWNKVPIIFLKNKVIIIRMVIKIF